MKKLNQRKIRWIVREFEKGELSTYQIAKQQEISEVHAWRVFQKYKGVQRPRLLPCGRKPKPLLQDEIDVVTGIAKATGYGAVSMEKILAADGVRIPHNRIHRILKQAGLARDELMKQKRRRWIRYERRHSNSLWHADWFTFDERQFILYEDDASRLITGAGEFASASSENSIIVFDSAVERWGTPKQLLTDRGIQFCTDEEKEFTFRKHVESRGVEHILSRVNHPQTNGKLERLNFTIKRLLRMGKSLNEAVMFYNEKRPHMSLENGHLRTPLQAFYEKKRNA